MARGRLAPAAGRKDGSSSRADLVQGFQLVHEPLGAHDALRRDCGRGGLKPAQPGWGSLGGASGAPYSRRSSGSVVRLPWTCCASSLEHWLVSDLAAAGPTTLCRFQTCAAGS